MQTVKGTEHEAIVGVCRLSGKESMYLNHAEKA